MMNCQRSQKIIGGVLPGIRFGRKEAGAVSLSPQRLPKGGLRWTNLRSCDWRCE